jgi:glucose/mannose transport system substrate-binding protein
MANRRADFARREGPTPYLERGMQISRRGALTLGLVAATSALTACESSIEREPDKTGDSRVEVFSWWVGPGLEEGLNAMVEDFRIKNPGIEFVNATVAGSAGSNAKALLRTRLQDSDPPDAYQVHAGLELASDVQADYVEDLSYLYDRQGWRQKLPKGLLDRLEIKGKIYAVPVNIHRANMMWYNPATLAKAGFGGPPKTWDELLGQAAVLKSKGIQPMVVGPASTHKHLLECVLLGELGPDVYMGLWNATTDWMSQSVQEALATFAKVLAYSDVKTPSTEWAGAADKIIAGTAGFLVLGDWVNAYMAVNKKLKYQTEYSATTSPGSAGVYNLVSDSFALPKGAPHRGAAEKWLIECGSVDGQDLFNPQKGSIPARIDTDASKYKDYLATSMAAWHDPNTKIVGSLTHGVVANNAWNAEIDKALAAFVVAGDAAKFATTVMTAYEATKS